MLIVFSLTIKAAFFVLTAYIPQCTKVQCATLCYNYCPDAKLIKKYVFSYTLNAIPEVIWTGR